MKKPMIRNCAACAWCMAELDPYDRERVSHLVCAYDPPRIVSTSTLHHSELPHVKQGDFCHNFEPRAKGARALVRNSRGSTFKLNAAREVQA